MSLTPQQQLAEVIEGELGRQYRGTARALGGAIVAAVNSGRIDPIVPDGAVTIFPADNYRAEMAELAELRAEVAECRAWKQAQEGGRRGE